MALGPIGHCLGGLVSVEVAISAVIYIVFIYYVVQHYSQQNYMREKSNYEKLIDYLEVLYETLLTNYLWLFFIFSFKLLILFSIIQRRKLREKFEWAFKNLEAVTYRIVLEKLETNTEAMSKSHMENNFKEMLTLTEIESIRRKRLFLSARPLPEASTPRNTEAGDATTELQGQKLRDIEMNSSDDKFFEPNDSIPKECMLNMHQDDDSPDTVNDLTLNLTPVCHEDTSEMNESVVRKNPRKDEGRDSIRKTFEKEHCLEQETYRQEINSPHNRPLVTAETTPVVSSGRFTPESSQIQETKTGGSIKDETDASKSKRFENFRRRHEIKQGIDVCPKQLDEPALSQCSAILTKHSSFRKSPKISVSSHNRSNIFPNRGNPTEVSSDSKLSKHFLKPIESLRTSGEFIRANNKYTRDVKESSSQSFVIKKKSTLNLQHSKSLVEQKFDTASTETTENDLIESNMDDEGQDANGKEAKNTYRIKDATLEDLCEKVLYKNSKIQAEFIESIEMNIASNQNTQLQSGDTLSPRNYNTVPVPQLIGNTGDMGGVFVNMQNRTARRRISTPYLVKESSTTSSTKEFDKYCGTSGHGDDMADSILQVVSQKQEETTSNSGDHLFSDGPDSPITNCNLLASDDLLSMFTSTNECRNGGNLEKEPIGTQTSTVETESELIKSDSLIIGPENELIERKSSNKTTLLNNPMPVNTTTWSMESDPVALQMLEVPKLEVCVMDPSLATETEFATISLQKNYCYNEKRPDVESFHSIQILGQKCKLVESFNGEKCHVIQITQLQISKTLEHESNRSFELLSFTSDIYVEKPPKVKKWPEMQLRTLRSPYHSSSERNPLSSPINISNRSSKLPVPVNRYPSNSSSLSNKTQSPCISLPISLNDGAQRQHRPKINDKGKDGRNSPTEFEFQPREDIYSGSKMSNRLTTHNNQTTQERKRSSSDNKQSKPSAWDGNSRCVAASGDKQLSARSGEINFKSEAKGLKLGSTLKQYSKQNVFNRLYNK